MSYGDVRNLPVPYRKWFIERVIKQFSEEAEARKKAMSSNNSESRQRDIPVEEIMEKIQEKSFKKF